MISLTDEDARSASERLSGGCDTMEQLLNGLLDSKGRVAEDVHAIRKLGKTLRGGFSLFRLKDSIKEIQAIGRLLSGPRDAVSRLSTWGKIGWEDDAPAGAAILGLLDQQTHSAARRPPPETIAWCQERVAAARKNLQELPVEALAERLAKGEKKLGKQAGKRCGKLDHDAEEDFHDARKAIKAYLGALKFLPETSVTPDPKLVDLAEILGDENDIATLSVWLEDHGFTADFVPTLWKKLKNARSSLRKQAIRDADLLANTRGG
ncbi:CHAD domain-containing protein [Luteolibacter yonseiensis]|uniref:CHAD domain-containing protein n=1 Tax=Luteolibacter yonseiensis TaxID=1144680 RepID=A0A934R1V1_9BACT|nr:CHAD domain-containing protein [Luteolibacter yonseiensis]MBK1815264.1 CHAD domain-containing protein [Luteolibacter yonseiensis]